MAVWKNGTQRVCFVPLFQGPIWERTNSKTLSVWPIFIFSILKNSLNKALECLLNILISINSCGTKKNWTNNILKKNHVITISNLKKHEIESLRFENLPVEEQRTNEEWMKNGEERRKTFTDLLTETSRKHYESTSTWIFFTETIVFTQNSWNA